ncbi:hypothetical protein HNR60_003140 [Rhodopseudomonas rhenobacensis]|uniref:Uncharacterized protein n=1 Tax=Rhodopseudomonas rhenobacensis TaxID=87461 RepID=A0A7W7Z5I9_9BRAD|nr:hypothetical protein [Rhodopseudomonas rhenobacensis]MBB5048374.1 hypothetical protein [Rhodopseudomonas rhenobacensis]
MIKQTDAKQGKSGERPATTKSCETIPAQLQPQTLAALDEWAAHNQVSRQEAVQRLVQLGLSVGSPGKPGKAIRNARAIELAASQIDKLIDPEAPSEERDRRIHRLTEGPPEFVEARVDLPKRRR